MPEALMEIRLKVPQSTLNRLKSRAFAEDRSVSYIVRRIVQDELCRNLSEGMEEAQG